MNYENNTNHDMYNEDKRTVTIGFFVAIISILSILLPIILIGGFCISSYNGLIKIDENVKFAQAEVETMMQRRLELIPDLVEITKQAANHEKSIYQNIADARIVLNTSFENDDVMAMDKANNQLTVAIENCLSVISENYPEIAASKQYTSLMDQLEGAINRITIARENYNESVYEYNSKIRSFPGVLFAKMLRFEKIEPFKADEKANNTNMVNFN